MSRPILRTIQKKEGPSLAKVLMGVVLGLGVVVGVAWVAPRLVTRLRGGVDDSEAAAGLEQARALQAQGKAGEARKLLEPIADGARNDALAPQALMLLAELETQEGATDQALIHLKRAATEFPTSPEHPKAAGAYARLLDDSGRHDEAAAMYQGIRDTAPPGLRVPALVGLGRQAERAGDKTGARDFFRQAVQDAEWNSRQWNEAVDELGRVNVALIFWPEPTPESKVYAVEAKDSFTSIGIKLNTTIGLLTRANGLGPDAKLHVGQQLKYTPKDFRIVIERSTCRLFLFDKDGMFKRYSVGLGMPGHETTLGEFKIGNKEKDPTWHKPGEGPIPPGDPRNELGTRWMPLVPVAEGLPTDLGIHGTNKPETVGGYTSHGCARLYPQEAEELYDLVVRSTLVQIVDTVNPETLG